MSDEIAPGYTAVIKNPMDMIKMQRKVDAHEYHSLKEFDSDVQLMVRNCERYRGKGDEYTKVRTDCHTGSMPLCVVTAIFTLFRLHL